MKLEEVILRGTSGAKPAATTVPVGTLYYSTDTTALERSNGTTWDSYSVAGAISTIRRQVTVIVDGGGAVITTGVKAYLSLPVAGTWKKWRILSVDSSVTSGSIVFDVWKDTYANYPPALADTITAAAKPTLSAATKAESSTLTGWVTTFSAGDVIGINVDSVSTVTKIQLVLEFE